MQNEDSFGTVRQIYDGVLLPDTQVRTFRHIDRLFPSRTIARGPQARPLPGRASGLQNFAFASQGKDYDLYDFLSINRVGGLLVLKNGEVRYETYQLGNTESTRWMSMSIAKTVTATLVGVAIQDGCIKSLADPITRYLPTLNHSAYDGVTVEQLLTMTSGVQWDETYTNPLSDRRRMLDLQIAQQPGAILDMMAGLPRAAEPGSRWNYSTGETHIAGALVRAATQCSLADYFSERIWSKLGTESDATWWLESPDGLEVGGSGISASLRDYGRFGLFLLNRGIIDGVEILPAGWMQAASRPFLASGAKIDYGYMVWPLPDTRHPVHQGAFQAIGIFGQHLYVNPAQNLVAMVWGALPKPMFKDQTQIQVEDFFAGLCVALQ